MTECTHTHMSRFKNDGLIHTYAHIDTTNLCVCAKAQQLCPTLCSPTDRGAWQATFVGFPRQEYRSGLPCPPPGGLPNPGIKPTSLMSPALTDRLFTTWEATNLSLLICKVDITGVFTDILCGLDELVFLKCLKYPLNL